MAKFVNGVDTLTMLLIREEILEFVSSVDTITLFQKSVDLRICLLIRTECPCISRCAPQTSGIHGGNRLVSTYDLPDSKPFKGGYFGVNFGHLKSEVFRFFWGGGISE